jgi:hypothetical protein
MPSNIKKFIDMTVDNLSRPFPSMRKITAFDYGDQMEDLVWPRLVLVYKASLRFFSSKIAIAINNSSFLSVLVLPRPPRAPGVPGCPRWGILEM